MGEITAQTHRYLERADREFPEIMTQIENFYSDLLSIIKEKQKEQVEHVKQTWDRMKYEYATLASQLDKFSLYCVEKIGGINNR